MPVMKKIYTGKGDEGRSEMRGKIIRKDEPLPEALGALDELNSWIGFSREKFFNLQFFIFNQSSKSKFSIKDLDQELKQIQTNLFVISSRLSGSRRNINPAETRRLEKLIDRLVEDLPTLSNFIYPAGELQVVRAVCRRAERRIVKIFNLQFSIYNEKQKTDILKYMNRLSDALFVMARWVNLHRGIKEEVRK
jgi:cob(I)alamin adenosyltransferase